MSVKSSLTRLAFCLFSTFPLCHAQNAIIFLGDGMGPTTIAATRILKLKTRIKIGALIRLALKNFLM